MIYPTILAIAEWLEDPVTSPNAHIPTLDKEPADAELEVRELRRVLHPFRDEAAFANTEPGAYPALYVTPASPVDVEGEVNQDELNGDEGFQVLLRIVVEEITSPKALRELAYLLEAMNRAVSAFFADTSAGQAARQRRHVQLIRCASRSYALAAEDVGAAKVGAALILNITLRDTEAT